MNELFGAGLAGTSGIVLILVVAWLMVLTIMAIAYSRRVSRLMRGKTGADLEELLTSQGTQIKELRGIIKDLETRTSILQDELNRTTSRVHLIRYSPFGQGNSMQSFSIALLDAGGTGVVLTSLQTQDGGTRLYSKPVESGTSSFRLSPEEEDAISKALNPS